MTPLAIAITVAAFLPGIALVVVGARGIQRARDWMGRAFSILALVLGAALTIIFGVAVGAHTPPVWNVLWTLVIGAVTVAALIFWVWVLSDCLLKETKEGTEKLVWAVVIVFTFLIGAGIYYFGRRERRMAELGR
ncbi:MAG: PLDc N-terminal domain-containing protein [Chloroflexota bacterium]